MKEHALPQDVVGYRFHIIGNMTLKQFAEVAAGCVVAFVIYSTNLPTLIKWPLIAIAAGAGALIAFVPFEERPLDHWVVALFHALYRPTQFYWSKTIKIPEPFLYKPKDVHASLIKEVDLTPARRQRVKEYLRSVDVTEEDTFDKNNASHLQEVMSVFDETVAATPQYAYATAETYAPQPSIAYEQPAEDLPTVTLSQTPQTQPQYATAPIILDAPAGPAPQIQFGAAAPLPPAAESAIPSTHVAVPQTDAISVEKTVVETNTAPEEMYYQNAAPGVFVDSATIQSGQQIEATQAVVQNKALPFPEKPKEPNKVVGMVIDQQNTPIQNAIVEILTPEGLPARAVKTNMLGQFFITTPLNNATYSIVVEKEGLQFSPMQLVINNTIIDPIEVRSL